MEEALEAPIFKDRVAKEEEGNITTTDSRTLAEEEEETASFNETAMAAAAHLRLFKPIRTVT